MIRLLNDLFCSLAICSNLVLSSFSIVMLLLVLSFLTTCITSNNYISTNNNCLQGGITILSYKYNQGGSNMEENEKEIWIPIINFEGLYEVSNCGRVKSLKRFNPKSGRTGRWYPERLLTLR